jgi:hypothetical protein
MRNSSDICASKSSTFQLSIALCILLIFSHDRMDPASAVQRVYATFSGDESADDDDVNTPVKASRCRSRSVSSACICPKQYS